MNIDSKIRFWEAISRGFTRLMLLRIPFDWIYDLYTWSHLKASRLRSQRIAAEYKEFEKLSQGIDEFLKRTDQHDCLNECMLGNVTIGH